MGSCKVLFYFQKVARLAFIILFLFSTNSVQGQFFEFNAKRKKVTIPFKFVKNLLIIPIHINGKGPFNFILDSGVGIAVITDARLIDTLSLKNIRSVAITGFGERKDIAAFIAPSIEYTLAPAIKGTITTAILRSDNFDLSGFTGIPIHGLIGFEFFASFIVRLNYSMSTVVIYPKEAHYILRKGYKIPITIEDHKPYMTTEIVMDHGKKIKVKLIIDTGAGHPVSLETIAGIPVEIPEKRIHANLGVGLAGMIDGYIARVPALRMGKYWLNDVIASFPDFAHVGSRVQSFNRNGNIGNGILRKFDLVFDYNRESLYFRSNSSFKDRFDHDMSGIEFTAFGEDLKRIMITRVEPGSAAARAGLLQDDEIISINFKPVKEMTVDEIDALFKSQDRRSFLIVFGRKGVNEPLRIILELQRRI